LHVRRPMFVVTTKLCTNQIKSYLLNGDLFSENRGDASNRLPRTPEHGDHAMSAIDKLSPLRAHAGARRTPGLDEATVQRCAAGHPARVEAIEAAPAAYAAVRRDHGEAASSAGQALLELDEDDQVQTVQAGVGSSYPQHGVNRYVALTAGGAWIVNL